MVDAPQTDATQTISPFRLRLRRAHDILQWSWGLRGLPWRVIWFQVRARRLAWDIGDHFSLVSATRPADLRLLVKLAAGRRAVVELGTATAWTTISLALADRERDVISYDPFDRPERLRYLGLVDGSTRARLQIIQRPGHTGPGEARDVEMLYIDSSHDHEGTVAEVLAWAPALRTGALVVFDDFGHPDYPGVTDAINELGLSGTVCRGPFAHEWAG